MTFENAYHEVTEIAGSKENMSFTITIFEDDTKQVSLGQKFYSFVPSVHYNSPNHFRQSYEYAMTLPEYEGATALIEDIQNEFSENS
ncbi:hypothetical protein JCM19047_2497 [Bacillus sp. JCM 19047]|nr:hypothetical protein JCM19047_2497 [Bacillus sp. JCM 19047]